MNARLPFVHESFRFHWFALAFALFWLGIISYLSYSPPIDTAEQLTWSRHAAWGYYKHPPLTTLLLIPFVRWIGLYEWVPGLLGAMLTLGSFYVLWDWVRGVLGVRAAWLTLLAVTCVSTYCYRLHYYNHDVLLMVTYLLAARLFWNVVQRGQLRDWAVAGAALGLAFLAKYQAVLILPALLLVTLKLGVLRRPGAFKGMALAAMCGLLVVSPHLVWLVQSNFLPFTYVQSSSLDAGLQGGAQLLHVVNWLLNQLQRGLSIGLMFLLLWCWKKFTRTPASADRPKPVAAPHPGTAEQQFVLYVSVLGWTPLVCMLLLGVFKGMYLQPHWMAPFFPLWVASCLVRRRTQAWLSTLPLRRIVLVFLVVQLLLAYVSWGTSVRGGYWGGKRYNRDFQSQKAADQLAISTQSIFPNGIPLVMGLSNIADVISLRLPHRPPVLVEGKMLYSPWLDSRDLQNKGALLVVQNREEAPAQLVNAGIDAHQCELQNVPDYGLWWCAIQPWGAAAKP